MIDKKGDRRILRAAKHTLADFNKLESSQHALALKVESFQIDPIYPETGLPTPVQLKEIKGIATKYHNEQYAKLLQTVVPLRNEFRLNKTFLGRQEIAQAELEGWKAYLAARKEEINVDMPTFQIDPKQLSMLKD
mgnify:FL=1